MNSTKMFWKVSLKGIVILAFVCLVILGGASAIQVRADTPDGSSGLISLDVVDADLSKVVLMLARESKQSIIIADHEKMQSKVSATLRNMPLETALKYIVESVGCSWYRKPDGTYIVGREPEPLPQSVASGDSQPTTRLADGSLALAPERQARRETRVESIKLYNANPVDMMWLMGLYSYEKAPEIKSAGIAPGVHLPGSQPLVPTQPTPPLVESLKSNLMYAERAPSVTGEAAQMMSPVPPGGVSYPRTGALGRPGMTPTAPGAPPAVPGAPTTTTAGLLPAGIDFIMPYELDNSLIVRGDDEGRDELKTLIRSLDVPPKQVSIKAEFVEISTVDSSSLGIDWSLQRLNTTFDTAFNPGGNVIVGYASGNVMATLRTQLLENKGKVVNAPIISTLNNVPAVIAIGRTVPYWTTVITSPGQGQLVTQTVPMFLPITTQLVVVPRINGDNSITVFLQPTVSDAGSPVKGPDGTEIPVTNAQSLVTNRRVANGETIVVGGIIRKSDRTDVTKIPLLGDLPIIGPLFRNTAKDTRDTELLIFLTPTIIPEKPTAGMGIGVTP